MIKSRILMIDDNPIITEAYSNSIIHFQTDNEDFNFHIDVAYCCDSALLLLEDNSYEVIFLDIRLPASKNKKFKSGEDLGFFIKKKFPNTKIIVITGYNDPLIIGKLLQNLNPEGLLFKGDVDSKTCPKALVSIMYNIPFYSSTILKLIRKKISSEILLSKTNKTLLYELAKGTKTKDLTKVLHLSVGGVERRKRHLKEVFQTDLKDDSALVVAAKEKGFI